MKKTLLSLVILTATSAFAQTTVTFDDLTLSPNSHWDGSDGSGFFVSNGITFENQYNMDWSYWSGGFIYSNTSDVTTAGYTNDFSAFTGIGAGGSANYAVNYGGNIDFVTPRTISSIAVTNTTYAALSMLYGDTYGKEFGSPYNAAGNLDGTNGEDFFRLLIKGYDANYSLTDSVIFYLADYRFADSTLDYIVDTWETIDLSSLGTIRYLDFSLESSDTNSLGILTPGYFALDNLVVGPAGISKNQNELIHIYPNPATTSVSVKGFQGQLTVRQANGTLVYSSTTSGLSIIDCQTWPSGYYLIELQDGNNVARSAFVKN